MKLQEGLKDFMETFWIMVGASVLTVICIFLMMFLFWAGFKLFGIEFKGDDSVRVEVVR